MNIQSEIVPAERHELWIDEPAFAMVAEFHQAFDHPISQKCITVEDLDTDMARLRMNLIGEEFLELVTAFADDGYAQTLVYRLQRIADDIRNGTHTRNLVDFIDANQDLKYVIYGAELALGISSEEHFGEVHAANMRKLGPDGKPIYREDGKVLKPEGWVGPDHEGLLAAISERNAIYG